MAKTMNKKTKNIISIVCIVLVTVLLCGVTMRLTDNFTKFKPSEVFAQKLNEDNLFVGQIKDVDSQLLSNGISYSIKNGVYSFSGKSTADDATKSFVVCEPLIELGTMKLKPGTYTFTCFDKPSTSGGCYTYGTFKVGEADHVWFADYTGDGIVNADKLKPTNNYVQHTRTMTLTQEAEITFYIAITKNADMNNVKAMPMIVSGAETADFYAPFFG